jgi:hypothetical protein
VVVRGGGEAAVSDDHGEYTLLYTNDDGTMQIRVTESRVWAMLEALAILGEEHTVRVALLGAEIALERIGMPATATKTQEISATVRDMLDGLTQQVLGSKWETLEERTIVLCYRLMQQKVINSWAEAAGLASRAFGREISAEAWSKRVNRWAEKNGRRPVKIYNKGGNKTDTAN